LRDSCRSFISKKKEKANEAGEENKGRADDATASVQKGGNEPAAERDEDEDEESEEEEDEGEERFEFTTIFMFVVASSEDSSRSSVTISVSQRRILRQKLLFVLKLVLSTGSSQNYHCDFYFDSDIMVVLFHSYVSSGTGENLK
jgi:hypothetical protein